MDAKSFAAETYWFSVWKITKEKAVATLKQCIFDPTLVKPKCVWEAVFYSKNCNKTAEKCNQIFENW